MIHLFTYLETQTWPPKLDVCFLWWRTLAIILHLCKSFCVSFRSLWCLRLNLDCTMETKLLINLDFLFAKAQFLKYFRFGLSYQDLKTKIHKLGKDSIEKNLFSTFNEIAYTPKDGKFYRNNEITRNGQSFFSVSTGLASTMNASFKHIKFSSAVGLVSHCCWSLHLQSLVVQWIQNFF